MSIQELLKLVQECLRDELIAQTEVKENIIEIFFLDGTKRQIIVA